MKLNPHPSNSKLVSRSTFQGLLLGLALAIGAAAPLAAQMTVDVQPDGPVTRCTGQGIVFSVVIVGGTPPYTYQWTKDGNDVPTQTGPTYTINPRSLSDEGNYNCKVTDSVLAYVNVVDPTPTFLDMQTPAQVLTQPTGSTICIGSTASISMTFGGTPPPTVVWKKGISTIANGPTGNGSTYVITTGPGTSTLQITNAQNADAGSYTVTVSGPCGAGTFFETSNPAVLVTDTTFPVFTNCGNLTINTDPGVCTGTFNFTPAATDNCAIALISPPVVNDSLSLGGPHPYNFSATDTNGNTTNCSMSVTVVDNQPPVLTVPAVPVFIVTPTAPLAVTFSVTATDNCGATVNAVPASGSLFPAGRTTVNCSASDGTNTVYGSFDVFVCVNPPAPATVWVDDNWVGLPNGTDVGSSRTIGCDAFATVQAGVSAVAASGTVNVAAGSYVENVSITKSLSLLGPQAGVDARGRVGPEATVSPAVTGSPAVNIAFNGTLTIDGLSFSGGTALGLVMTSAGPNDGMQIVNDRFSGYSGSALFMNRSGTDITIDKNVMDGSSIPSTGQAIFCNGPQNYLGLWITNNWIKNNTGRAGFFVDGNHNVTESATRTALISGNLFDNNSVGMNLGTRSFGKLGAPTLGPYAGTISENTFSNQALDGFQGAFQHVLVTRNNFTNNGRTGVALTSFGNLGLDRGAQNSVLTENVFSGNATEDMLFSSSQAPGLISTNRAYGNRFASATAVTYNETVLAEQETIDCSGNWWGSNTGPTLASHPGGAGSVIGGAASSKVDFTPWLNSGTDTALLTAGFQGSFSSIHVDDDSIQSGAAGRITEGSTVVTTGGLVQVHAGTYVENATVSKRCTIDGAGSGGNGAANPATHTIIQAASASSPAISIAATGLNAGNRLVLSNLRTTGATSSDGIATAVTPCDFLHIEAVTSVSNSNGIHFGVSSGSTNDVEITNCVLSSNSNDGLRVASAMSSTTALRVTGGEMKLNNVHGFGFNSSILATCFGDDFTIDGTIFTDNGSLIAGNGTGHVSLLGFNGSALLKDLTMSGTAYVPIQLRGKAPTAALGTVAFQNVVVSGSTARPAVYVQVYTSLSNLSFTGLNLSGMSSSNAPGGFFSNGGMILDHTGPSVPLGNTIFPCQGAGYVGLGMGNSGGASADCTTVFGGATSLAQKEACVLDMNDVPALGDVTFNDAYASVPPVGGTVCEGSPFTFTVTAGGLGPFTYQWRQNGNPILGAMSPSYMIAAAVPANSGSYDVVITNACGSELSPAAILNVNPLPVAPSSASSSPPNVCFGVGGNITLTASGGSGTTLEWRTGSCGGSLVGTGNGLVIAAPTADTTYFARWTTVCGMSACASILVTVQQPPTTNAGGPYSICYLAPVAVSGTASDAASVLWTSSGTGSFASPSSLSTSYTPSLADAISGSVVLTLTANPIAPCLVAASSMATLTITGSPNVVYVDDGYVGQLPGAQVAFPFGGGGPLHTIGCDAFATIQGGVDAVAAPGTVNVAAGSYLEDVSVGKVVAILGAGATSIVTGPIGGAGATFQFGSDGVVLDGFTITRQGNNTTDWNNAGLNTAGVAIQGRTSGTVRNCLITGNRTGIDINNSTGISVHNDVIDDNRTGLIFRNLADNCAVFESSISNNWTVGVLFLDGSVGTNSPPQTANGALFTGNAIAGNWYGQIVDRQTGGALPLPGTNKKNFSANWLGSVTPVITTANSTEPGYAAQIPVAFGGSATPPGGQPDVCGPASANFDITPMLESGVDTNINLGNGISGFQGDYSALTVTDEIAQTGAAGRVTEGATLVTVGGTVHVQAGTYVENATVPKRCTIDGAGSGGNGAANPATHTIIQAASASSPAISIAATGLNAGNRLVLSDLRTTGATSSDGIATAVTPCNFLHIEGVTSVGNSNGIHFGVSSGSTNDVEITNCVLSSNSNDGLRVASAMSSTTALRVTGGEMKLNNVHGIGFNPSILATCFGDDFTIDGTVFTDNGSIIAGNGTGHVSLTGFNGSALLKDLTMSGTAFVPIQLRGKTPSAALGTVAFQNVVVSGSTPRPAVYIQVYTSLSNVSFTGLNLSGMSSSNPPGTFFSNGGMILDHTGPSVPLGNTMFPCQGVGYVGLGIGNTGGAVASCATVFGGATTLAQKEACVFDVNDFAGIGDVTFDDAYASVPPAGGTICEGSPFTFTVTAGGLGPFTYQWRQNGNPILGAMSPSYMIAAAVPANSGSYDVVITNACGSELSPAVILTVNPLPVAPSSASSSPPSVCFGVVGNITLTASGGSGTTLEWRTGSCGGPLVGTGNGLVIPAPAANTTYFARWTTVCGISTCASVPVTVQLPPAAGAGGPYMTCHVTPVAVSGTANDAVSVLWTSNGTGFFASPSSLSTSYTPSIADATAGSVVLTLTANPIAPCLVAASAMATLTITPQSTWYQDADNDGFGNPAMPQLACTQPPGYVSDNTDCNDANPLVKPTGIEICNGIDDNCNSQIDEICARNDHCATATAITNGSVSGNNTLAGNEIGALTCGLVVNDVWYSYTNTLSCQKTVTVSMCPSDGGGASFDAVIHAFSGTCGSLVLLACSNNACGTNPKVSFTVAPLSTAYIAVSAVAPGPGGSFTMIVSHATALMGQLGPGCSAGGGPGPTLLLNAVPILNQPRILAVLGAAPSSTGVLLFSPPPVSFTSLGSGCLLYLNQGNMAVLTFIVTDAMGNTFIAATVPNDPSLECAQLVAQAVIFPLGGVPAFQVSSGLGVVLGY